MLAGRLQILPDREEIDLGRAQVVHHLQHLVPLFAQPDHDARLGEDGRIDFLDPLQQPDRMEIARTGPHREIVRWHGFQIVVEHVGFCRDHDFQRAFLAQEVRREDFDGCGRAAHADGPNGLRKMFGAPVSEIVAVDRGDDDMRQSQFIGRLRHMLGL